VEGTSLENHGNEVSKATGRLLSIDAFRGATMALMVLVNNAGDGDASYAPLQHSQWNGWTITDVVFPTFLFIVGISITLASRAVVLTHVFRRTAILYALGLLVYLFPYFDFSTMRVLGVLQRIAICYLAGSLIHTWLAGKTETEKRKWLMGIIVLLLGGYWLLMTLVPVPGYGAGRLDVDGNLAHYVDSVVLGKHNYANTKTWDPEGIVSTFPAIATTLFGILAGMVLRSGRSLWERTTILFVAGNALIAAGLVCNHWLPINKKLWTSSFCLFMAGLGFVLLAMFVYWLDGRGYGRWAKPFVILGRNAIVVYLASEFLAEALDDLHWQGWLYQHLFAPLASPANASLLWAMAFTGVMYLLAWVMYRNNWIVRI
jgi:predicted acyltransferase